MLLAALDQTIVGTAMPRIISELQGFEHYAWVTTAYLLTSTAVVPIVGKLSDLYGRKQLYLGGMLLFVLASAACAAANSMFLLILGRTIQGIGGAAILALTFTLIADLYPPEERFCPSCRMPQYGHVIGQRAGVPSDLQYPWHRGHSCPMRPSLSEAMKTLKQSGNGGGLSGCPIPAR